MVQGSYSLLVCEILTVTLVFSESSLRHIVRMIATQSEELIEIVNLNVENEQYVCAGTVSLDSDLQMTFLFEMRC